MKWKRALEALSGAKMKESMKADEIRRYPKRFMMKNDGNLSLKIGIACHTQQNKEKSEKSFIK